jgi:hypothetical protein
MRRTVSKMMAGQVGVVGRTRRVTSKRLVATASATAAMRRSVGKRLLATVSISAKITRSIGKRLVATVGTVARVRKSLSHRMAAVIGTAARIRTFRRLIVAVTRYYRREEPVRLFAPRLRVAAQESARIRAVSRIWPRWNAVRTYAARVRQAAGQVNVHIAAVRTYTRRERAIRGVARRIVSLAVEPVRIRIRTSYTARLSARGTYARVPSKENGLTMGAPLVNSDNDCTIGLTDNRTGNPLTGATVRLTLTDPNGSVVVNSQQATEINPPSGNYRYSPTSTVWSIPGIYTARWVGTGAGGEKVDVTDLVTVVTS